MAVHVVCDGCDAHEAVTEPFQVFGIVEKVHACQKCVPDIEAYLKARDDLHDACAKKWAAGMNALEKKHKVIPR